MMIPDVLTTRRNTTEEKIARLIERLNERDANKIVNGGACVYTTGSLGRGEMSSRSDLDIFILRDRSASPALTNLDAIRLKARLIEVAREQRYPEFSRDGEFIVVHDLKEDVIDKLGTNEDDHANVFTARMLLILESRPLLGEEFYRRAIDDVIAVYWRDFAQNSQHFLPVFLMNDILRFWKTLCLNYEERTAKGSPGKRNLLNYKLKHSRLLTCYSAVIYLQSILRRDNGTVSIEAVKEMVTWTPTQRLEQVAMMDSELVPAVESILAKYVNFLQACDADDTELAARGESPGQARGNHAGRQPRAA